MRLRARAGVPSRRDYVEGGISDSREIARVAAAAGLDLSAASQVLDFGCGAGRVLRHLEGLTPRARSTGCDVDPEAIGWAERHLPQLSVHVSGFEPPLPFPSDTFALIYSVSVFSHLDRVVQDRWLAELSRVLRVGGLALLSVHGASAFEAFRHGSVQSSWCRPQAFARAPLADDEFVFEPYARSALNRRELSAMGSGYGLSFHGRAYLAEHWGTFLDVLEIRPRAFSDWQDLVVCRRSAASPNRDAASGLTQGVSPELRSAPEGPPDSGTTARPGRFAGPVQAGWHRQ